MGYHTWKQYLHSMFTSFKMGRGNSVSIWSQGAPGSLRPTAFQSPNTVRYCPVGCDLLLSGNTVLGGWGNSE